MPVSTDITNHRFGRLFAVKAVDRSRWRFRCDCGSETVAHKSNVVGGLTRSCGCLRRELSSARRTTHGHTRNGRRTKTYASWASMFERCYNPHTKNFPDWGGRGIVVCERWHSFENFFADMGECPAGLTLDRVDGDGNYRPDNCRWATRTEQNRHKRNIKLTAGLAALIRTDARHVTDIAKAFKVSRGTVYGIKNGTIWR